MSHQSMARQAPRFKPMGTKNSSFLAMAMGKDSLNLQFLRELNQNALEAINRAGGSGEVIWDVFWPFLNKHGTRKLCVIDNGIGMSPEDMVTYINNLACSGGVQAFDANFGCGAKISALPRNPHGIIYMSWQNGEGYMIRMGINEITKEFGLEVQYSPETGTYEDYLPVCDEWKPDIIKDHGTVVVLMGKDAKEDTITCPSNGPGTKAAIPGKWFVRNLNGRYLDFPKDIDVKGRAGWKNSSSLAGAPKGYCGWKYTTDKKSTVKNRLDSIRGQKYMLDEHSLHSGTLQMSGAKAHWWILKPNTKENPWHSNFGNFYRVGGHIATLYQNELYDLCEGQAGRSKLQMFGVTFGWKSVVLYVEPEEGAPNTQRSSIIIDGSSVPWEDWAIEFVTNLPKEIDEHVESVGNISGDVSTGKNTRERLKSILHFFDKMSKYRMDPKGIYDVSSTMETDINGVPTLPDPGTEDDRSKERDGLINDIIIENERVRQKKKKIVGGEHLAGVKRGSDKKASKLNDPDIFPEIVWVGLAEGTREPNDLVDRAGRFVPDVTCKTPGKVTMNSDFRVFQDIIRYHHKENGGKKSTLPVITKAVHDVFGTTVAEVVGALRTLIGGSEEWTESDLKHATTEFAITSVCMQRLYSDQHIRRIIGGTLGRTAGGKNGGDVE